MHAMEPSFLVVGQIRKVHGTRGEVFVLPLTDRPESTFAVGAELRIAQGGGGRTTEGGERPDESRPPLVVSAVRPFKDGVLVHFEGVHSRNASELLRGEYLLRPLEELEPLDEDEVFYHQLIGAQVFLPDGALLGRVQEVYPVAPSDLLEVRTPRGPVLIPFNRHVVTEVDREQGILRITPPEGLLDL
jgi:16S rRNA processing protein RimM